MVSLVMLADSALSTAARRRGLAAGSATPARVATVISRISLVYTLARLASSAFLRPSMDGPLPMGENLNDGQAADFTPTGAQTTHPCGSSSGAEAKRPCRRKCTAWRAASADSNRPVWLVST